MPDGLKHASIEKSAAGYLPRFAVTINTAAAGGNASLVAMDA
jgi:delta 1-pyrroline-5-carboxylate dehydrogenase